MTVQRAWIIYILLIFSAVASVSWYAGFRYGDAQGKASRLPIVWVKTGDNVNLYKALQGIGVEMTDQQQKELAKKIKGRCED